MRQTGDRRRLASPSMQDAEKACEELHDQVERAKQVLRDYRAILGAPLTDNDNRKPR